jgi:hypothetical protein
LYRPVLADPPVYTMADLNAWVTLKHVMDAHELLDLKAAMGERAAENRKGKARR